MRLLPDNKKNLVNAAIGKEPMDLIIKNVNLVNVFTGEVYPVNIGVYGEFIAHVENREEGNNSKTIMEGKEIFDGNDEYIIPGLIDSHVHIESSMMTPENFAKVVIPHGTTTVITDPHEIANVMGKKAIRYMLEASQNLPMRQYILVPSCVPSVPGLETGGAEFENEDIAEMLEWDRVLGLAEVMDFPGVINNSQRMTDILNCTNKKEKFIQGHAPGLSGRKLSAYLCAGPKSDHEIRNGAEAKEKLRKGMIVDARESSMSQNVESIISAVNNFNYLNNLTFCTDDREPEDLLKEGHINHAINQAIMSGMDPIRAIRSSTLNAARAAGIEKLGAIAPGYAADFLILPNLKDVNPTYVFSKGELVAKKGELTKKISKESYKLEKINSVHVNNLKKKNFTIKAPKKSGKIATRVISYETYNSSITKFDIENLPVKKGYINIDNYEDLKYVFVLNRYNKSNNQSGIVRNFGLNKGAVASTVSHDCHNLTIVSNNPTDAFIAAKALIKKGGGIICAHKGEVKEFLNLPIGGLMSPLPCNKMIVQISKMKSALKKLGIPGKNPLLRIATLALPVIPNAKITDKGLVEVNEQKLVSLFYKKS